MPATKCSCSSTTRVPAAATGRCAAAIRTPNLAAQRSTAEFDEGHYINPGPWRIPYHHEHLLHYCNELGVKLQPFIQVNHNAYLHNTNAFGGKPQRWRAYTSDFHGSIAELLAKSVSQHGLDAPLTKEDGEVLMAALQLWGALDKNYRYVVNDDTSDRRGYDRDPGGGLTGKPIFSQPIAPKDVIQSGLWQYPWISSIYEFQTPMFQPVGGMGRIGEAFGASSARSSATARA